MNFETIIGLEIHVEGIKRRIRLNRIHMELHKALEKEEKRQIELYVLGEEDKIKQETRRWDGLRGETVVMRSKEDAHDYRYFPEPDLAPIIVSDSQICKLTADLPELPMEKRRRFAELYGLKDKEIDILIGDKALARYYEALTACGTNPRTAANWVLGNMLKQLNEKELEADRIPVKPEVLFRLTELIDKGEISITAAQEVFGEMFNTGKSADQVVKEKERGQISDAMVLKGMIMGVLADNPQSMIDYNAGKTQAAGFLMGQVMKASKGKANPQLAKALLDEQLKDSISDKITE